MPERRTRKTSKSPSSEAGEFVHEEIEHVRSGKHGARSAKQAIAIGLSKARKAGIKLPPPPSGKTPKTRRQKPSPARSRASLRALRKEGPQAASHESLSRQARSSARRRGPASLRKSAQKAARTRARKAA